MDAATAPAVYDQAQLQYRRQFILGPQSFGYLKTWKKVALRTTLFLTAHPDLHVETARNGFASITVLGDVLDPENPDAGNREIIDELLGILCEGPNFDGFIERTFRFAGRWIMIVDNGREIRLYHDAAGMRQIFYHVSKVGPSAGVWCASQPLLLARGIGLIEDPKLTKLVDELKLIREEYWWPGGRSRYRGVELLLPNHYLDLGNGQPHRYWPVRSRIEMPLDEVVNLAGNLFPKIMRAASRRFPLALPITAGLDSRVILAASRDIRDQLHYYTLLYYDLTRQSPDTYVPARLLKKLALDHHVYECPKQMDEEFGRIYRENVQDAHDVWGPIAQGLWNYLPPDHVCVRGTVSEVARCFYMRKRDKPQPRCGLEIAACVKQDKNEYWVTTIDDWHSAIGDTCGYHIMDMFYWEHRLGVWGAANYTEWDIAQDVFSPYSCRELLTILLSANEKHRQTPEYTLYRELLKQLWPDVLCEPINPHLTSSLPKKTVNLHPVSPLSRKNLAKKVGVSVLKRMHLLEFARKMKNKIRK